MDVEEIVVEETYYGRTRTGRMRDACGRQYRQRLSGSWDWDEPDGDDDGFPQGWDPIEADEDECGRWPVGECADEDGRSGGNREIGRRGEDAAARYLEHAGLHIVERNWKCPAGEADIVAYDEDALVFVEVKTRRGISNGFPSDSVDARKRARYEKIAMWYLRKHDVVDTPVRFDIIAIVVVARDRAFMKHYVNAFGVER